MEIGKCTIQNSKCGTSAAADSSCLRIYLCRCTAVDPTRTLVPASLELQDLEPNTWRGACGGAVTLVYLLVRWLFYLSGADQVATLV